jgi:CRISPR-associated protein Csb2
MIAGPVGDDRILRHLAILLDGQQLSPTPETRLDHPPTLVLAVRDNVARFYTKSATNWASVTPLILPGHNDHKPDKTRKLIEKALHQSGIDLPCEFEWSPFSHFPKSQSAFKYDRDKRPTGYIRPDHLLSQTAVHLTLRFDGSVKVPGPLAIGAGRHCGLGLMAAIE